MRRLTYGDLRSGDMLVWGTLGEVDLVLCMPGWHHHEYDTMNILSCRGGQGERGGFHGLSFETISINADTVLDGGMIRVFRGGERINP